MSWNNSHRGWCGPSSRERQRDQQSHYMYNNHNQTQNYYGDRRYNPNQREYNPNQREYNPNQRAYYHNQRDYNVNSWGQGGSSQPGNRDPQYHNDGSRYNEWSSMHVRQWNRQPSNYQSYDYQHGANRNSRDQWPERPYSAQYQGHRPAPSLPDRINRNINYDSGRKEGENYILAYILSS